MQRLKLLLFLFSCVGVASAGEESFANGPVFEDYGPVARVELSKPLNNDMILKHSFDVSKPSDNDAPISTLVSAARFINMHATAGIDTKNIAVAVVVHGKAVLAMADENSTSADLIARLSEHGVRIIVCGQSAAYYDVQTDNLLPGVEMALSAMTAHALLQQQGYTLNPF